MKACPRLILFVVICGLGVVTLPLATRAGVIPTNSFDPTAFAAANLGSGIDLDSGLVGHWALNDGAGSFAADSSGYNNHGSLSNGPVWTAGKMGGGLRFDGVNDFVDVPDAPALNFTSNITLAAWFNSANLAASAILVSKGEAGGQYHLRIFTGSVRFRATIAGTEISYEPSYAGFTNGFWYHAAAVYDGTNAKVYVNGALIGKPLALSGLMSTSAVNLALGKRTGSTANNWFNGVLDDVRVYSRALSAAEIAALANLPDDRAWDYGDAPDPTYPTLAASNGARHAVGRLCLGARVSPKSDGQPSPDASNDADDDGIVFDTPISPGMDASVEVTVSLPCRLNAWLDFDGNGSWNDPGEQIFVDVPLTAGLSTLSFPIPATAQLGPTYARFRVSTAGGLAPTGPANDGEVEDYRVQITAPVTNAAPPTIANVIPAPGADVGSLTNIQVTFSEAVAGVSAQDLLVGGVPATSVSGSGSNYNFTVSAFALGPVDITWASGHGIHAQGLPPFPFDETSPGATWSYNLVDLTPPSVAALNPPAGATVTNLAQIEVTFSEKVMNVDAADLLVNNIPAGGLSGGGSDFVFTFPPPAGGPVTISWAPDHGITDAAGNPFDTSGPGGTWNYTAQWPRITLVASNSNWRYFKGLTEASAPTTVWRQLSFDDSAWPLGSAAFYYGPDPYTGTCLTDMSNSYSCVFIRQAFVIDAPACLTNLLLRVQSDDGCVIWVNETNIARVRVPTGEIPFNGTANANAPEFPSGGIAMWTNLTVANPQSYLVPGTNVIAIQALNVSLAGSSDFGIDVELSADLTDKCVDHTPRDLAIALLPDGINLALAFTAAADFAYTIESAKKLSLPSWQRLQYISPAPTNRLVQVILPRLDSAQFYRLRSP